MADITAAMVKALRAATDLPMMECKRALTEADGDQDKAIEILRDQFKKISVKRAGQETAEGCVCISITDDGAKGVMIELQCESAPVAANDEFKALASQCAKQLLNGPGADSADDLLQQEAPDHPGRKLNDLYEDVVSKIREKIVVARIICLDGPVAGYVHHDGKTGCLFQATGGEGLPEVLRDVAMHIAALKPTVTHVAELDQASVQEERDRLTEEAKATGKPDNIIEKIVEGRMNNFYQEEGVLVVQAFAKDDSKSVSQALAEAGFEAKGFTMWALGS